MDQQRQEIRRFHSRMHPKIFQEADQEALHDNQDQHQLKGVIETLLGDCTLALGQTPGVDHSLESAHHLRTGQLVEEDQSLD
jgi:hypothetical protein